MEQRPKVYDPIVLRDRAGRQFASRVENLGEGLVVVAQPAALPDEDAFPHGTELGVAWSESVDQVAVLPTRILAAHTEREMRLWSLIVTGPPELEQRRRVERVDVAGPVVLRPPGTEPAAVTGSLIDLSEQALKCSVATGSADGFLSDRNEVVAEFSLGAAAFAVAGRVEFVRATKNPTQFEQLVVLFDEPVDEVDALRKHLFVEEARTPVTPPEDGDRGPQPA